jgi:hypothetical protein
MDCWAVVIVVVANSSFAPFIPSNLRLFRAATGGRAVDGKITPGAIAALQGGGNSVIRYSVIRITEQTFALPSNPCL